MGCWLFDKDQYYILFNFQALTFGLQLLGTDEDTCEVSASSRDRGRAFVTMDVEPQTDRPVVGDMELGIKMLPFF